MAGRKRSAANIEEKIEAQKEVVSKAKDKYDAEVEKLAQMMEKRDEMRRTELWQTYASSERSYEEVIEFLKEKRG